MSREAPRPQATVKLLNLIDIERGASLRAESAAVAVSVARELSEAMTRAERIATHELLTDVARAVRWPADGHPVQAPRCPDPGGSRRAEQASRHNRLCRDAAIPGQ
jgi:hypothetical protein